MKMKYALVNGERLEAQPGLKGMCSLCKAPVIARCGKIRRWHWAHLGNLECDLWWKNKTDWHIDWQNKFPKLWQEFPHEAPNGDKHFADVKTDQGWVLEFQNSIIKPDERDSRNSFYPKIVWVVNGMRRKNDLKKFLEVVKNDGVQINPKPQIIKLRGYWDESALLRDWANSPVPVFFDFGDASNLWYLIPKSSDGLIYVVKFSRSYFVDLFLNGTQKAKELEFWFKELSKLVSDFTLNERARVRAQNPSPQPFQAGWRRPPQSFQQFLPRMDRSRRRF